MSAALPYSSYSSTETDTHLYVVPAETVQLQSEVTTTIQGTADLSQQVAASDGVLTDTINGDMTGVMLLYPDGNVTYATLPCHSKPVGNQLL